MSKYASGEEPRVGDVVAHFNDEPGLQKYAEFAKEYAVTEYSPVKECVTVNGHRLYASRFKLIRRAEPASPWIPGPPPESCLNAIVCDPGINGGHPVADHKGFRGEWPARIVRHIPIEIPPVPVDPLKLPRRFRAKHNSLGEVTGVLLPCGNYTWANRETYRHDSTPETQPTSLTDIEFVDPE